LVSDFLVAVGIVIVILLASSPYTAVILLSIFAFLFTYSKMMAPKLDQFGRKRQQFEGQRINVLSTIFSNLDEIFVSRSTQSVREQFRDKIDKLTANDKNILFFTLIPRPVVEFAGILSVMLLSLAVIIENEFRIDLILMELSILLLGFLRILPPISRILNSLQRIKISSAAYEILHKSNQINTARSNPVAIFDRKTKIEYRRKSDVLFRNLDLSKSLMIGIKGKSGAGKSSFVRTMLGLPTWPLFDIKAATQIEPEQTRYTFLSSNTAVLQGNIRENLCFYFPGEEEINLKISLTNSGLIPPNFKTEQLDVFFERDVATLSQGETQRLKISMMLLGRPDIMVLDEALNSLDSKSEIDVLKRIRKLNIKIIYISHSNNADHLMDQKIRI
jgi:ABC-type multidrug transport system fused ATPase/permease subunit